MKTIHTITIRVFVKENENEEEITKTLEFMFPYDLEEEKVKLERKQATGFEERKIIIKTILLEKQKHITEFVRNLFERLKENQLAFLRKQIESRLDEELRFYIRLDKTALQKGIYQLVDHGNCYHITLVIAAYPKNRDKAKEIVEELLMGDRNINLVN